MPDFNEIAKFITEKWDLLAAIVVLLGASGLAGAVYRERQDRRQAQRLRYIPRGDFPFEVIPPRSPDLLPRIMGSEGDDPLADHNIPYQERQPDRSVRRELEAAFTEKNWVLILGKSGLGKTREAAHLAEVLNQEGWTVLRLAEQSGEWLDVPKEFPSEIRPDDRLLFFLDDLNRWMYAGNPHEIHPEAGEKLELSLQEPVQERLLRLLQYFENQCRSGYVRVIATARDEREPDKPGQLSPWEKLQWQKYKSFWQEFYCYRLEEPSEGAIVKLLTDCVAKAGLEGNSAEYEQIAGRNDGTFGNITANLEIAQNRDLQVNYGEFSQRLDETWRRRYNKAVERYPLAKYVYDAAELLRTLNLQLTEPMLFATTKCLLPGRRVGRWRQEWQLRRVLDYLVTMEKILTPKDGQIEGKKTPTVDVGRYVQVILQQLGQMAKQDPNYPVAAEYLYCGVALHALNHYEEAIASFDKAIELKPDYHEAWHHRGFLLDSLGRYEEAIASFDKAIELNPNDDYSWHFRGYALRALGRYEEAITSIDKAIELDPNNHYFWHHRGSLLDSLGRCEEAIASFDRAIELNPNNHYSWHFRSSVLHALKRHEDAITSIDKAIELDPNNHDFWRHRGSLLDSLGRYEEAIANYNEAIKLNPNDHYSRCSHGFSLCSLGRYEEAIASFDKDIELNPDSGSWFFRGTALTELERYEEAVADYDKAIQLTPNDQSVWMSRGLPLMKLERYEDVIANFSKLIELNPNKHDAWFYHGFALMKSKQFKAAHKSYDRAIALNPDDASAYYGKARCYALQQKVDLGINTLQQAITLDSQFREKAKTSSDLDGIRQDDRFQALLETSSPIDPT